MHERISRVWIRRESLLARIVLTQHAISKQCQVFARRPGRGSLFSSGRRDVRASPATDWARTCVSKGPIAGRGGRTIPPTGPLVIHAARLRSRWTTQKPGPRMAEWIHEQYEGHRDRIVQPLLQRRGQCARLPGDAHQYEDLAPNGTNPNHSIFVLGWAGNDGRGANIPNDPLVVSTLMRWGTMTLPPLRFTGIPRRCRAAFPGSPIPFRPITTCPPRCSFPRHQPGGARLGELLRGPRLAPTSQAGPAPAATLTISPPSSATITAQGTAAGS